MHHPTDSIAHTTAFVTPVVEHWLERKIAQCVHPVKDRSDDPSHTEQTLLPRNYISFPLGFGDVWYSQYVNNIECVLKCVKMRLTDNFIQERDSILDNSSKCNIYVRISMKQNLAQFGWSAEKQTIVELRSEF